MYTDPFNAVIAAAERRRAELAAAEAERKAAAEQLRQERATQAAVDRQKQQLRDFGHRFLSAVATRVVKPDWSPDFLRSVKQYSEGLLMQQPVELPKLDSRTTKAILDKFAYSLKLADGAVPDGTFYGQQLLAERDTELAANQNRPKHRRIGQGKPEKPIAIDEARKRLRSHSGKPDDRPQAVTAKSKNRRAFTS